MAADGCFWCECLLVLLAQQLGDGGELNVGRALVDGADLWMAPATDSQRAGSASVGSSGGRNACGRPGPNLAVAVKLFRGKVLGEADAADQLDALGGDTLGDL